MPAISWPFTFSFYCFNPFQPLGMASSCCFSEGIHSLLFATIPPFHRSSRLRKNASLRLILVLTGSDLAFAITSIPYSLHYLLFWSPIKLDYDGRLVVALSTPLTVQMKLNLCLSTAIALDRLQVFSSVLQ